MVMSMDNLSVKQWKGIKRAAKRRFNGSGRLFEACWRQYKGYTNSAISEPNNIREVMGWLDSIASEKVNNPNSRFYILG